MGFTAWLLLIYVILALFAGIAFMKKKRAVGIAVVCIMALGIIVLGYLWVTSPM